MRRVKLATGLAAGVLGILAGWDIAAFHISRALLRTAGSMAAAFGPGVDTEARVPSALLVALSVAIALSALLHARRNTTPTAALVTTLTLMQVVCIGPFVPSPLQAHLPPLQLSRGTFFAPWPGLLSIGALFIPAALASLACVAAGWASRSPLRLRAAAA